MDYTELADQINYLGQTSDGEIRLVAADSKTEMVTRIAAILLSVMLLEDPISLAATEVVCDLTNPDSDDIDPMTSPIGIHIQNMVKLDEGQLTEIANDEAKGGRPLAGFILAVDSDEPVHNPDLDHILRRTTGRDLKWWHRWVLDQRR